MAENMYKSAGVDVEAGYEAVRLIKDHVKKTTIEGVLGGIGGFGGLFEIPEGYTEIGESMFSECDKLKKVTIASTVEIR